MKKRKVLKSWVNELLQATMMICFFAMMTNATQDMFMLIVSECLLGSIAMICGILLGKYSRDFIDEN